MTDFNVAAPVIILDRDGTIVIDRHYLGDPAGLEFLPGATAGLKRFAELGCRIVILTNQSGVGRGLITTEQVQSVNYSLCRMIREIGAEIHGVYFCPHLPDAGCDCRKPAPGLLLQAARELDFEPASAVVIGDKESDVQLGKRVGARAILIAGNTVATGTRTHADFVVEGLADAARLLSSGLFSGK